MNRGMRRLGIAVLALVALPACAEVVGRVVNVADGDTLTVLVDERAQVTVRVAGIDAPERLQNFGRQSQNALAALTVGKTVRISNEFKDTNGRTVGKVLVVDSNCQPPACGEPVDVGLAQVAGGFAWSKKQSWELLGEDHNRYEQAELKAKLQRLGLWSEKNPMAPWLWRRNRLDE